MPKMKVIVETEIRTRGKKFCDELCQHNSNNYYDNNFCSLFDAELDVKDNDDTMRCAKCLEATKNILPFTTRRTK